jgi:16S rRNA (guanine966-N2)-methyltransferase
MTLYLIGGEFKGRRLKSPKGPHIRPTTGIVRKAVFDICKEQLEGAHFLDLFAGTGAMGLEALSRGASHATFIDHDKEALRCLQENIALLALETRATLLKGEALTLLKRLKGRFEIIYVDPPYGKISLKELLRFFDASPLLADAGILFIEDAFPSEENLETLLLKTLTHKDSRRFGSSNLHQFRRA